MKVIDTHVHLVQTVAGSGCEGELRSLGKDGRAIYPTGKVIQLIPPELGGDQVTAETMLQEMDANGVEKAVLLQGYYYGLQNQYSYDAMKKYPDRFLAAAMYDPFCRSADEIRHYLFEELGIRAVKFETSTGSGLMGNREFRLNDPVMMNAAEYAASKNQVFVIDIGKCQSPSWQIPELLELIKSQPQMKFVICHLLACNQSQESLLIDALKQLALPNVWFDLASVPHNCLPDAYPYPHAMHYVDLARNLVGADRLLFATDMPSARKEDTYQNYINMYRDSEILNTREKEMILHDNAVDVFFS